MKTCSNDDHNNDNEEVEEHEEGGDGDGERGGEGGGGEKKRTYVLVIFLSSKTISTVKSQEVRRIINFSGYVPHSVCQFPALGSNVHWLYCSQVHQEHLHAADIALDGMRETSVNQISETVTGIK